MTAEELESKIQFSVVRVDPHRDRLIGKLVVRGEIMFDHNLSIRTDMVLNEARKAVAELIMRHLYEDQRRALWEAIDELFLANPMDYREINAARERILKAAHRQNRAVLTGK